MYVTLVWFEFLRPRLPKDFSVRPPVKRTGVGSVLDPYEGAQASDKATGVDTVALRVQGTVVIWDLAAQPHRWL